jgi:hypothetical protein
MNKKQISETLRLKWKTDTEWKMRVEEGRNEYLKSDKRKDDLKAIGVASKKRWDNPFYKERVRKSMRDNSREWTDDRKIKQSEISKSLWKNPVLRKKMFGPKDKSYITVDYRKRLSDVHKLQWQDVVYREKMVAIRKTQTTKETLKKKSVSMKKVWANLEYKNKMVEKRKKQGLIMHLAKLNKVSYKEVENNLSFYVNHKVKAIEFLGYEDVYDLVNVTPSSNFALANGIFVHNCTIDIPYGERILNGTFFGGSPWTVKRLQVVTQPKQLLFGFNNRYGKTWEYSIRLADMVEVKASKNGIYTPIYDGPDNLVTKDRIEKRKD